MAFFSSLPKTAHVADVFAQFPRGLEALMAFHDAVLRQESELSIGEREMIAAYVSALNDCQFCFNSHRVYSAKFGVDPELFDALMTDIESAPVSARLKPLLNYARKLTKEPAKMMQADVDVVLRAGWSETAVHDAMLVVCLFNFMNRLIFGHGLDSHDSMYEERLNDALAKSPQDREAANQESVGEQTYQGFMAQLRKNR